MKRLLKQDVADILSLSPLQEGLLFHYLENPYSTLYFEQLSITLSGHISTETFEKTWNFVIKSHEALRSVFRWEKMEKPVQIILKEYLPEPAYFDLSNTPDETKQEQITAIKIKDRNTPFDLQDVPLRITLCKLDKNRFEMIVSSHHILFDGWSTGIILQDFFSAYRSFSNRQLPLIPHKGQLKNCLKEIQNKNSAAEKTYWQNYFQDFTEPAGLSIKHDSKGKELTGPDTLSIPLNRTLMEKIEAFSQQFKITPAAFFYTAFGILLQKYNNCHESIIGTTTSGRDEKIKGIETMVGLFIDTLPLRVKNNEGQTAGNLLNSINQALLERKKFEMTGTVTIKEYCSLTGMESLFDTILVIENYPLEKRVILENSNLSIDSYSMFETTHYDLTVIISTSENPGIELLFFHSSLEKECVKRLAQHFILIIEKILENPKLHVNQIEITTDEEKQEILTLFNSTSIDFHPGKTFPRIFDDSTKQYPDHIGVTGHNQESKDPIHLSYSRFNRECDRFANLLNEKSIAAGSIIAVLLERSCNMISTIIGIFKTGCAYLPIDPDYPPERIDYILKDSSSKLLVTTKLTIEKIHMENFDGEIIFLDEEKTNLTPTPDNRDIAKNLKNERLQYPSPDSPAYVIYTSGSTGKPKGVMVDHSALINLLAALQDRYPLKSQDTFLLKTSYIFDVSITELLGWPFEGGKVAVLQPSGEKDPITILDEIERERITHINFVPSMFSVFESSLTTANIGKLKSIKWIFLAGEAFPAELAERFRRWGTGISLENLYGPTEATVYASWYSLSQWNQKGTIPIGKPIHNAFLVILNKWMQLQPPGIPGELFIAGTGTARGYLNNPELSAERFLTHELHELHELEEKGDRQENAQKLLLDNFNINKSFGKVQETLSRKGFLAAGGNLYKSGDLCRWLPDGNIEYLGRIDFQVKIRGFRVELGEIESILFSLGHFKEVVVTLCESENKDRYLAAYFVLKTPSIPGDEVQTTTWREYLGKFLPSYMIPGYWVKLDTIPRTVSGKIERKKLPLPGWIRKNQYTPARNKRDEIIIETWSAILGVEKDKIGIDDNFFELGGHSLKITGMTGRLHKRLDIEIPFTAVFNFPTVRGIAGYIAAASKKKHRPITAVEEKEYYPLSPTQRRFYVFQQLNPHSSSYNMMEIILLEGPLPAKRFEYCLQELIRRHESLRTSFHLIDGEPVQRIHAQVHSGIRYYNKEEVKRIGQDEIAREFGKAFSLDCAPLLRVGVAQSEQDKYLFIFNMHHLVGDGTSNGLFIRDFLALYHDRHLPGLKTRYVDYVEWRNSVKQEDRSGEKTSFSTPDGEDELLNLPTDFPRPPAPTYEGKTFLFDLDAQESNRIYDFCKAFDVTLYIALMGVYTVLLSKLSGQTCISVGSPIAGRGHIDLENVIGLFLNIICVKSRPEEQKHFSNYLKEIKAIFLNAAESQDFQYDELVNAATAAKAAGRNPLFDVMLVLQNMDMPEIIIPGLKITRSVGETTTAKFDMTLSCEEKGYLAFGWEFSTALFKKETISSFSRYFRHIIAQILHLKDMQIGDIEILPDQEKLLFLLDLNDTERAYPAEKTVHGLIAEQAERTPDRLAVMGNSIIKKSIEDQNPHFSYKKINTMSTRLSRVLRKRGVTANVPVGIMIERSVEMLVGVLGILKAGGTYVPLDPQYPNERIWGMLDASKTKLVLSQNDLIEQKGMNFPSGKRKLEETNEKQETKTGVDVEWLAVDDDYTQWRDIEEANLGFELGAAPQDLIYIIFTSGSTGTPKGAGVFHRGFTNLMNWFVTDFGLNDGDCAMLLTSPSFDLTQKNFYASLMTGGILDIPRIDYFDPALLLKVISRHAVTWFNCTPGMFYKLVEHERITGIKSTDTLRYVFLGGEPIAMPLIVDWIETHPNKVEIVNTYGPTECTDICASFRIREPRRFLKEIIPVGKPIYNVQLVVASPTLRLVPTGVVGELSITGDGVGIGYVNDTDMTARKFFHHTFHPTQGMKRFYRTGDLVKWRHDGNIEFVGRIDHQVKIRGFRIETGEIESKILSHGGVKEVMVMARERQAGDKYLCAYIVPHDLSHFNHSHLREFLSEKLPDYMIPSFFITLEKMPMTPNGKIDRKALPEPGSESEPIYEPPSDEIEAGLQVLWGEVLNKDKGRIGMEDHFFLIGGHSLRAAGLVGRIHKEFKVDITIAELFKKPTIRGIAGYIREKRQEASPAPAAVEKREYYGVSSAQKRLFILHQMIKNSTAYNVPAFYTAEGSFSKTKLQKTVEELIQRHESFRTSFFMIDGQPVQKVHDNAVLTIEEYDSFTASPTSSLSSQFQFFVRPFDLSKAPLLRVGTVPLEENRFALLVDMHHIITDVISNDILFRDFAALYEGETLHPLKLQYKDYAQWCIDQKEKNTYKIQEDFWRREFAGEIPVLNLPPGFPPGSTPSYAGSAVDFEITAHQLEFLNRIASDSEATLFMVCLGLLDVLLGKLCSQDDIVIGVPMAGRRSPQLEKIIGMFVNTLPVRNHSKPHWPFIELIKSIKEKILAVFDNQDYPFEELVETLALDRDMNRNPLFDALFAWQNANTTPTGIHPGSTRPRFQPVPLETTAAKFDLTFRAALTKENILCRWEFRSTRFKQETIERWALYFKTLVNSLMDNTHLSLFELEIIPAEEKNRLLYEFNRTGTGYQPGKNIIGLFQETANKNPDRPALVYSGDNGDDGPSNEFFTYTYLNEEANRLAETLKRNRIGQGDIAALLLEPSPHIIIGILGVLKAGCAYLPMSPDWPKSRLDYMLKDSNAKILVTHEHVTKKHEYKDFEIETLCLDTYKNPQDFASPNNNNSNSNNNTNETPQFKIEANVEVSNPTNTGSSPVYIIYTSGTTGKPKGVVIENRNLTNYVNWFTRVGEIGHLDKTLLVTSYAFDLGYTLIYSALSKGAELHIAGRDLYMVPQRFLSYIQTRRLTYLKTTPSLFGSIVETPSIIKFNLHTLRLILLGGEAIQVPAVEKFHRLFPHIRIMNHYGPTETTIGSIARYIDFNSFHQYKTHPTIGHPIDNTQIYILGKNNLLAPIGTPGELYIAGAGTARGYLNQPELSAERFLTHELHELNEFEEKGDRQENGARHSQETQYNKPALQTPPHAVGQKGDRQEKSQYQRSQTTPTKSFYGVQGRFLKKEPLGTLYKTGDLCRWLPDGNIEYLGRMDFQVKIRGYRVEIGEVLQEVSKYPSVKEAAVLTPEREDGEKYLCAYLVLHDNQSLHEDDLRQYLLEQLPDYMVPSFFITLEKMPLTPNGKIDRRALPDPGFGVRREYTGPANAVEKALCTMWAELLKVDEKRIGVHHNFFRLGGHSLKAIGLMGRVLKEFGVELPIGEIFKNPTIRGIGNYIQTCGMNLSGFEHIAPIEERDYYPLSSSQKRLYVLQQMTLEGTVYNVSKAVQISGNLDRQRLENAFRELIRRHEVLRTSFHFNIIEGEPVQRVHDRVDFNIEYHESNESVNSDSQQIINSFIRPFDLSKAPLLRVGLINPEPGKYIVLVDMHHIISDGTSAGILIKEFAAFYKLENLPGLGIQYKDYAAWHNKEKTKPGLKTQEEYWLNELEGEIPELALPIDFQRPKVQEFEGEVIGFEIEGLEKKNLDRLALDHGVTLYMVLLTAYSILLSKLGGIETMIIGTPTAGRHHPDLEPLIGVFIDTLPVKIQLFGDKTVGESIKETGDKSIRAFSNQDYPYEDLVDRLNVPRSTGRNPLFDVMFVFQEAEPDRLKLPDLEISPYPIKTHTSRLDLLFAALDEHDRVSFSVEYCSKLFKPRTIERFINYFKQILSVLSKNVNIPVSQVEMMPGKEKLEILYEFNNTAADFPSSKTIIQLFRDQAERTPDFTAVSGYSCRWDAAGENLVITYRQLDVLSERIAYRLHEHGIGPDTPAAIMMERSIEMIIGIMAILKAGGAYLPIDPLYPRERIEYILNDSSAAVLITTASAAREIDTARTSEDKNNTRILFADSHEFLHFSSSPSHPAPLIPAQPSNLAYIIYTSGSTGKPKGVMIDNYSVVNRLNWMQKIYPLDKTSKILQKTPVIFDVSVWELLWWSFYGASLHLLEPGGEKDPGKIAGAICTQTITTLHFVPSMLNAFLDYIEDNSMMAVFKYVRRVFSSGEALSSEQVKRFNRLSHSSGSNPTQLVNLYGPTEATVDVSFFNCNMEESLVPTRIPIGKPIDNTLLLILDKWMQLQPVGIPGELYIAGTGTARGYLNNPELSAERFLTHELHELHEFEKKGDSQKNGARHSQETQHDKPALQTPPHAVGYRTGDLCRWLSDGNIEFLGRMDYQVKIRGLRIELEEIEKCLLRFQGIKEAVVSIIEETEGDKVLAAYWVSDTDPDTPRLREYLSQNLPEYMVPGYWVRLDQMPLTRSGKIDRKALPKPGPICTAITGNYALDEQEKQLISIWSEILHIDPRNIPPDANFFRLGGHSLRALNVISRIHKAFQIKIPLGEFFNNPTIQGLSALLHLRNGNTSRFFSMKPAEKKGYYPLSSAQKRLYILQQLDRDTIAYNLPVIAVMNGQLDFEKIKRTFSLLIARHESLRTSFHNIQEVPVQVVHDADTVKFEVKYEKLRGIEPGCLDRDFVGDFVRPFDLGQAPLLRVKIAEMGETMHLLMMDMHHIITDGTSQEILRREFAVLYDGEEGHAGALPALKCQYKDFAEWQNKPDQREAIQEQEKYWLDQFEEEIPVLSLPIDFPRPSFQVFEGQIVSFTLEERETALLHRAASGENATLYMVLLALYTVFLSRLTGQEDIIVGTPTAGRQHADLQDIIGMFVNTLGIRSFPAGRKTFRAFLAEIKQKTLDAFENQDYPFEELVEKTAVKRDAGRNPLFDTFFTLHNIDIKETTIRGLSYMPYEFQKGTSRFDLSLYASEKEHGLVFDIEYSTRLFEASTIQRFIGYFKNLVTGISDDMECRIEAVDIIPGPEKDMLLYTFNNTGIGNGTGTNTELSIPFDQTIHQRFEEQVEKSPDRAAIIGKSIKPGYESGDFYIQLSYRRLNECANRAAAALNEKGVTPGEIVGLKMERCVEMIIGILGILKAGGTYLPIDPLYPQERIDYILGDSGAKFIITPSFLEKDGEHVLSTSPGNRLDTRPHSLSPSYSLPGQTPYAYIIYTSGSTGKPKGVPVEHYPVVCILQALQEKYPVTADDTYLFKTSVTFDVSITELFGWFMGGGRAAVLEKEGERDPVTILDTIENSRVTHINFVPSMFHAFLEYLQSRENHLSKLSSLKYIFLAGEALSPRLVERFIRLNTGICLENLYGPTECTVYAGSYSLADWKGSNSIPIGKPLPNTRFYVFNKYSQLQPIGTAGELYISGTCVARGYLNQPELSAERFLTHELHELNEFEEKGDSQKNAHLFVKRWDQKLLLTPLRGDLLWRQALSGGLLNGQPLREKELSINNYQLTINNEIQKVQKGDRQVNGVRHSQEAQHDKPALQTPPHAVGYKTGDLARWLPDGNMEFLGRIDHQVKIRGFRIELGEIESILEKHERIREAVVIAKEDRNSDKFLCAYIVKSKHFENEITTADLRDYLAHHIPGYMIPSHFIMIDRLPLNRSGKIDRKSLPEPTFSTGHTDYTPPGSLVEEKLTALWEEVLGVKPIGVTDNFFTLGGHSLKAMILISRISKEWGVEFPLKKVFESPYIRDFARYIQQEAQTSTSMEIEAVEKKEYYPLSSIQKRMLFLHQAQEEIGTGYNIPGFYQVEGHLDKKRFTDALRSLVDRHEALRTSFHFIQNDNVQVVRDKIEFNPVEADFTSRGSDKEELERWIAAFIVPFNLAEAPLFRAALVTLEANKSLLLFDMHHIISDGTSRTILIDEFAALYGGEQLPPLRIQYKDFAVWQNDLYHTEVFKRKEAYWLKLLSGELPRADLPTDYPRAEAMRYEGDTYTVNLGEETTARLQEILKEQDTTLFIYLLAVVTILLKNYYNNDDIIIGCGIAGRRHADLQSIIGMLANVLPLRLRIHHHMTFAHFLDEARETGIDAFENQEVQFERLVEKLNIRRDASRNPIFDLLFMVQNFAPPSLNIRDIHITPYSPPAGLTKTSKYDISLFIGDNPENIRVYIEYATSLFRPETIEKFAHRLLEILDQAMTDPGIPIENIRVASQLASIEVKIPEEENDDFNF